jgi:hypothetical protein
MPGDSVLFARGQVFKGHLSIQKSGTSSQPVYIGAYGNGELPVITGSRHGISIESKDYINLN